MTTLEEQVREQVRQNLPDIALRAAEVSKQQQQLQHDLRRQLKEEIGDDEDVPEKTMQALRQKFGLSTLPITATSLEKFWVRYEEGAAQ